MSYQFDSRVRYSEIGSDGKLSLNALVNYFQDSSTFHSESIGLGISGLSRKHRVWVLSSWQIVIEKMPKLGDDIIIQTWPYDFKGFYGSRNFALKDKEGNRLAYANSLWIYMDTDSNRPSKVDKEQQEGYELEEKLDMTYAKRKIDLPSEGVAKPEFLVLRSHLDTNQHVNNGQYIRLGEEYLPEDFRFSQVRAEYKKSAVYQQRICPVLYEEKERIIVALNDENERAYAVIEFTKESV